ncbi:quinate pathway repressor protein QutR [Purpureocillium lilacinum]|uniref:Quinate pathway repressor protein QutR n=1 Tax=Purpureocillium lilacinum TaxID=33203 RepID=A0A179GLE3_PURLI|nr:quinate pathway repressor protein QutR [Purpureocillium lilacinum]OAQ77929.1 quinate pathway repressor protein QutR [Purpureocillium lilacinum]GJN66112.1 hypothetical protein PLICBS_000128 [Purpureocillium lilacinum]
MAGVKRSLAAMMAHDGVSPGVSSDSSPASRHGFTPSHGPKSASRTPTPPLRPVRGDIPSFTSDASIVIVGVRGAGKSTLAIMAASALKKRIVDLETAFQRATSLSSAGFKQKNGTAECQARQAEVLDDVLRQNPAGAIVVCSWMERRIQDLLRRFAATNPVVHVVRSVDAIQDYLKIADKTTAQNLLNMTNFYFRTCTNLEFFNVSEIHTATRGREEPDGATPAAPPPYLALQQAERHFLKFLSLIYPAGTIPFFESAFPLASISPEQRQFTYALSLDMRDVLSGHAEWHDSTVGVDAVQIFVNSLVVARGGSAIPDLFPVIANDITEAVAVVRRSTMLPILLHIKLPEQTIDEVLRLYLDLLTHALCLAPEMLTVDLRLDSADISRIMSAKRRSKLIGNYFTSTDTQPWDSPTWLSWYQKACRMGCDMVRLVRFAMAMEDNFAISRLRARVSLLEGDGIPLIAYNSGPIGRHSTCFNPILTLVAAKPVDPSNAGQAPFPYITAKEVTRALYSSFVYDSMKLYVFGANVGYSMSPAMHNAALAACGIPHRYEPFSSASLSGVKQLLQDPNFGGASVGLPFKVEVITLTHSLSPHAQAIGAVNTLIPIRQLNQDGSIPTGADLFRGVNRAGPVQALYGENTDWIGVRACIRRGLSPANAVRPTTWGLIIGAGGMARAATYAMLQVGVKNIAIYNRTPANAEKMAAHFRQLLQKRDFELLSNGSETQFRILQSLNEPWPSDCRLPSIIISCIPTHPIRNTPSPEFELPEQWLGHQTGGVIIELGYKTLNTPLLAQARNAASRGWVAMDGLDLLPEQGFAQFELFTGRRAPRRVMRREVLENYTDEEGRSHLAELHGRLRSIVEQDS